MIGKTILGLGASLALMAQPLAAQEADSGDQQAEFLEAMQTMFPREPLTPEQEARLPLAGSIVDKMIPPGTLGEMMGGMFDQMLGPIMQMVASNPRGDVARQLGMDASELDLSEEQVVELADLLDPVWRERNEAIARVMPNLMKDMMATMEPSMRKAMTEAYAIYFDQQELADIDAFFSTPSGLSFARKSFTMSSDPRIIGASMEAMPAMMESIATMETRMEEATADLPAERGWEDLGSAERARVAELTGLDQSEIEENLAFMAEIEAMENESEDSAVGAASEEGEEQ